VSVRWRPLSTHSRKRFWKFCITRCSMVGEITATSSLMFCFQSTVVLGFFSYTLLLRYPQRKKYCDYGHSFRWILKCRRNILWVKTESLFLKIVSTAKARCSTDQRSMATEMLWVSLALKGKFPTPTVSLTAVLPNRQIFLPDPVDSWRIFFAFVITRWFGLDVLLLF